MFRLPQLIYKSSRLFFKLPSYRFAFSTLNKVCSSIDEAVQDIKDGQTILVGGFGLCGTPQNLINGIQKKGVKNLTIVSNDIGIENEGLGVLLKARQIKKCISSYIGENRELEKLYLDGEVAVEFVPQGSLAEKCRAGGAGIPAFFTPAGVGTLVETGNFPIKFKKGTHEPEIVSQPKRKEVWDGKEYLLEPSIKGDVALIKALKADVKGNLVFNKTARNLNADFATAAKITIAEVEEIVEAGQIDVDAVHLSGVYVTKVVKAERKEKKFQKLVHRRHEHTEEKLTPEQELRYGIAQRACKEIKNGMYINLGVGIPTLITRFLPAGVQVELESENGILGFGDHPEPGQEDPDLINAGKETITANPGASCFSSCQSFGIIRGGHLDLTVLGAMQVSQSGDIASWIIPGKMVKGMGGAMDLVGSGTRVMVTMSHTSKGGAHKILKECSLPLTGKGVVDTLVTEMATFEFRNGEMILKEIAEGYSLEDVRKNTGCDFKIANNLKSS